MRIINLIDNEAGKTECSFEHGLSFYIETTKHKLLVDFGPSKDFITNAKLLGVDLKNVDIAFLSHGHYDHSGGIIPFSELNDHSPIYMQKSVSNDYYSEKEGGLKYIGIDKEITSLNQVKIIEGDLTIDDE
nr:MBL fold metallo-hydrolase [Lachnospiraceae bacterium]